MLLQNKLKRKDENPNLLQQNSTTKKSDSRSNTPGSEKETKHKRSLKTLRENFFASKFINRFSISSIRPAKHDKQESTAQAHIAQTSTFAKRIRNAIRLKAPTVSPGFIEITEPKIQEFDSIARPLQTQEDAWQQQDRRCICKRFGEKAEKYVICDEWEKKGEKDYESELLDDGVYANSKETGEN